MKSLNINILLILLVCVLISNSLIFAQVDVSTYNVPIKFKNDTLNVSRKIISEWAEETLEIEPNKLLSKLNEAAEKAIEVAAIGQNLDISNLDINKAVEEIRPFLLQERNALLKSKKVIRLSHAPSTWGKTIQSSSGEIYYYDKFQEAFSGGIKLEGLAPNQGYFLSMQGKTSSPSYKYLPQIDDNNQRYFDFLQVNTDSTGKIIEKFNIAMKPSNYNVNFFVKDINDWKVVLYNDILIFTVVEKSDN